MPLAAASFPPAEPPERRAFLVPGHAAAVLPRRSKCQPAVVGQGSRESLARGGQSLAEGHHQQLDDGRHAPVGERRAGARQREGSHTAMARRHAADRHAPAMDAARRHRRRHAAGPAIGFRRGLARAEPDGGPRRAEAEHRHAGPPHALQRRAPTAGTARQRHGHLPRHLHRQPRRARPPSHVCWAKSTTRWDYSREAR